MGVGDEIIAAGIAQRQYDQTGYAALILDYRRKPRWHPIWEGNPIIVNPHDRDEIYALKQPVKVRPIVNGPKCRPYIVYPFTPESGWRFNTQFHARDYIAKIYLTPEEHAYGRAMLDRVGPYVLIEPWSKHPNLRWPLSSWEALIHRLPHVQFVQHVSGNAPLIMAPNVTLIHTSFRDACALVQYARCYVRGESGMLHAAAALGTPTVAIWGGCMDWDVLGGYPKEIGVGVTPPFCGRYKPCAHCYALMSKIPVDDVVHALGTLGVE